MRTLLWCKSNFSFLEGASHPEELVEAAHQLGYSAIAITDRDGVYGVVRGHEKAKELGIKLIIGAEVTHDDRATIVLLAMTRRGYRSLCRLLTVGRMRCEKGRSEFSRTEVAHTSKTWWRCGGSMGRTKSCRRRCYLPGARKRGELRCLLLPGHSPPSIS